jgi:hypothetical protein
MAITGLQHRIRIEGGGPGSPLAATVRLGYHLAARLGHWKVEGDSFTAAVETVDGFRITQSPLTLEIQNADGIPTRRPLGDVTVYQGQLSARLLPKRQEP